MKKIKILAVLVLMIAIAVPAFAAYDIYLQAEGVAGTANDATHKDWIQVTEIKDNTLKTGGTVGLVISKAIDSNSGSLYRKCLTGTPMQNAQLDVCKDGVLFFRILLRDVAIGQIKPELISGNPKEELTFGFKQINWEYFSADGKSLGRNGWDNELKRPL